jgi:hypothetical protein
MPGFLVEDPHHWLSKSQKEKIKVWFRDHFKEDRKEYAEVLDRIHYGDESHRYNQVRVTLDETQQVYRVQFSKAAALPEPEVDLRERLRAKLKMSSENRNSTHGRGEDWKMYHKLLQCPAVKMIPAERLSMVLPNPDGVRKQRDQYEQFQKVCPDPVLQEYFQLCLQA